MIINFEFWQKCWLLSNVLTSWKSFVTFDVDLKHFDKIFRFFKVSGKKVTSLPCYFTIEKSLSKIFNINFLFEPRQANSVLIAYMRAAKVQASLRIHAVDRKRVRLACKRP